MWVERQPPKTTKAGWKIDQYIGGPCKLDIHSDGNGPFAYTLKHKDALYAPDVNLTPVAGKAVTVRVLLSFRHITAELQQSNRVGRAVDEIRAFFEECVKMGILEIEP